MRTIRATFEGGVFRPTEAVELPEHCSVEFEPRVVGVSCEPSHSDEADETDGLDAIYEVLSRRYDTGEHDAAARHNEHQP